MRVARLAGLVADKRLEVTGRALRGPSFDAWPTDTADSDSFAALVSECYKWLREMWREDVWFLAERAGVLRANADGIWRFLSSIRYLRTAQQHTDNPEAVEKTERWLTDACGSANPREPDEWRKCGIALIKEAEACLEVLVGLARAAAQNVSVSQDWARLAVSEELVDPGAQRAAIAADLGLSLPGSSVGFIDRQIEYEWAQRRRGLTASDDAAEELVKLVERYLVGWSLSSLPCHYGLILERVGLQPGPGALSPILLAHVVADGSNYGSIDEFLDEFARMWILMHG